MAVGAATDWKVVVAGVVLSTWAHDVQIEDEKEKLDASGFSPTGNRTYVPGLRDQTVTVQFRNDMASGGPFQTIKPLYEGGSVFPFFVQRDSDAGTSSTNPIYGGSASVYSFPVGASLNEIEELEIEFAPATNSVFNWGTVAP
jgi:hypothetical protein